ncbi:hypothetical protein [Chitinophaga arvensicola]|uniref:Uncharacterized protein n=1 Tax=Chitinophaga arvensicola TaxID=29529 RepID=A0A1I0RM68_9BACT|nr:hypothetical protein [Chitinophaga arvensicola]SEW42259.1 hypothetical protein SAMN04488122_3084 [Chitinophaga arvensicola]
MHVQFNLQTLGYIVAEFETKAGKIKIGHSSTYGDQFQELLNKIFHIYQLERRSETDFFPCSFEVMWYDDRVNYEWRIECDHAACKLQVKVFELSTSDKKYRRELVNEIISLDSLLGDILLSLENLWHRFGFIGYKTNWEVGNFPMYELLTLKADRSGWNILPEKANEEDDWRQKVATENEIDLLLFKKP